MYSGIWYFEILLLIWFMRLLYVYFGALVCLAVSGLIDFTNLIFGTSTFWNVNLLDTIYKSSFVVLTMVFLILKF